MRARVWWFSSINIGLIEQNKRYKTDRELINDVDDDDDDDDDKDGDDDDDDDDKVCEATRWSFENVREFEIW